MKALAPLGAALMLAAADGSGPPPPSLRDGKAMAPPPEIVLAVAVTSKARPEPPNKIGDHRFLPAGALSKGKWDKSLRVWRLALRSPGAAAMRVHFLDFHAGQGQAWVHNGKAWFGPYTGNGLYGDGDFWSHVVPGDCLVIEFAPASAVRAVSTAPPPFSVREVSHLARNPLE